MQENQQNVDVGVGSHSLRGAERDSEGTGVFSDKKQVSGSNPPLLLLTDFPEGLSQSSTDMYSLVSLLKSPGVDTILRTFIHSEQLIFSQQSWRTKFSMKKEAYKALHEHSQHL